MSSHLSNKIAFFLLLFVFILAVSSIIDDSLTMDELAHLPAGYSYLTQKDMRLNPEHPPLVKDISAIPLLFFKDIKFPSEIKDWKEDVNGQWGLGNYFLFKTGNSAEKIIFWARIPMILLLLLVGFYIFRWTKELFGPRSALLALFIFSFSPTFLAHGRLVTTDVAAAFGVIFASYYFIKFLKNSSKTNLLKAGLALGVAELLKFSLILLIPFFGIITLYWIIIKSSNLKEFRKIFLKYFGYYILIGLIAFVLIWLIYLYHIWNYPPEKQKTDTEFILSSFGSRTLANLAIWLSDKPILRAIGHYLLGLFMIFQRAAGGNTGYFMGEVSAAGWKNYFPTVFFLKETLTFHILNLLVLLYLLKNFLKNIIKKKNSLFLNIKEKIFNTFRKNFIAFSFLFFIGIYWLTSLVSNLNIGVRHLLPIFPFSIILLAGMTIKMLRKKREKYYGFSKIKTAVLAVLLCWQAYSVLSVYPYFLTYFNESIGGPSQGYKYVVDSNLDWGQDLKRLKIWLDQNKIDKIYIDYFGGSDTNYYLKGKGISWCGCCSKPNDLPPNSYLAVSATLLQGGRGKPAKGFDQPHSYYNWLNEYQPITVIGNSIFVYRIK